MKQIRGNLVLVLILLIVALCSGCSSHSTMKVNKDGSGTFSCKYSIDKKLYTSSTYVTIKDSKELVAQLEKKVPKGANVKFTLDTTSSKTQDFITATFSYSSLQEFDKIASILTEAAEAEVPNDSSFITEETVKKYFDSIDTDKVLSDLLVSYLKENKIEADVNSANYKIVFAELKAIFDKVDVEIEKELSAEDDQLTSENALQSESDEDYNIDDILSNTDDYDEGITPTTSKIVNNSSKNALLVNADSLMALQGYTSSVITNYISTKIDIDKILKELVAKEIEINTNICKDVFAELKLQDTFKDISTMTEDQTKAIFTDAYKANVTKVYKTTAKNYTDKFINEYTDNMTTILNNSSKSLDSMDIKYTIDYAGKSRTFSLEELAYNTSDNGYVSITIGSAIQLDNTPKTGDSSSLGLHILLAIFMVSSMIIVSKKLKS